MAALVLAILYTLGAVLIAGALRAAHLNVASTLEVVPSQQFLSRGVSVFVTSFGFVLFTVIWLTVAAWNAVRWEQRRREARRIRTEIEMHRGKLLALGDDPEVPDLLDELQQLDERLDRSEPRLSKPVKKILWIAAALTVLACGYARLVDVPWLLVIALLIALAAAEVLAHVWLPLTTSAVIYLSALMIAFYYPTSLAPIRLSVTNGARPSSIRAALISQTGGHWYLATSRHKILVLPDASVTRAEISPAGRPHYPRRLYQVILSWF